MNLRVLLFIGLLLAARPAVAADHPLRGVALVIGETRYGDLPELANPAKDARDIDQLLGDLGFDVDRVLNADRARLEEAIADFTEAAKDADVALVYYSGHGIEAKGQNYIAPIDTDLSTPESAGASLVAVQPILEALSKAAPVTIVLLDACRSDPFPPGQMIVLPGDATPLPVRSEGLAAVRGPTPLRKAEADPKTLGAVIGFAAEPGEPALDGAPGENSPYAAALLKHLAAGGYSFGDVMTMVSEEVYLKTKAKQLPWTNSSLRRVLTFAVAEAHEDGDQAAIRTERRKLLLSISGTPAATRSYVETLAGEEKVPLDALYGMLHALGVDPASGSGNLEQKLKTGAERLRELLAEKAGTAKQDPELQRYSGLAEEAESEGAVALALQYRDKATVRADALLADRQSEAAKLRQDMGDIAQTYADNAATAVLNFDHRHAAELFGKAYDAVKEWDAAAALRYKTGQADALTDLGYYTADNGSLTAALEAYGQALALAAKDTAPFDWAKIEDRIGQAQQTLGMRLADPAMLQASVQSYAAALTVRTEAGVPDDWAKTENNLANALYSLGERNGDTALIQQAIAAFDASLRVFTPTDEPAKWATVQSNRGAAQVKLAELVYAATDSLEMAAATAGDADPTNIPAVKAARETANAALGEAISSLHAALDASSQSSNPLDRAMLQHTLASALAQRGQMNHSPDDLRNAAASYRAVLKVHTRERTPAQWLQTSNNLAITLKKLADETADPAPLREAVLLYRAVIGATSRTDLPLEWADFQQNLGNALGSLAEYEEAPQNFEGALAAYRLAAEVTTFDRGVAKWRSVQVAITSTLLSAGLKTFDKAKLQESRAVAVATRDRLREVGQPDDSFFDMYLPVVDQALALIP